jgi:hypothetical protein
LFRHCRDNLNDELAPTQTIKKARLFAERQAITAEEAAAWSPCSAAGLTDLKGDEWLDPDRGPPPRGEPIRLEADGFFSSSCVAQIGGEYHTSLVVTTRNIHPQQSFRGSAGNLTTSTNMPAMRATMQLWVHCQERAGRNITRRRSQLISDF